MRFKPAFEAMALEYEGKAIFVKIDVDAQPQISAKYGIECMPTFICFKNSIKQGEPVQGASEQLVRQLVLSNL